MSVGYGSGVGKERVIRWDLRSQAFGVHASAASFADLSVASPVEMGHLGLGVAMIQAQVIQGANASMGHLAENIYNMGVANATQGHTVAAPAQTQLQILIAVAADQGHTSTPDVLTKNLPAVGANMGHTADPDILTKNVLQANATMGHLGTALQMTLTVGDATMGHNGLAVSLGAAGANLTVVAGIMDHAGKAVEGFSPTQLADLGLWLAPESGYTVSGASIERWNDKSGLANHAVQTVSASMPILVSAVLNDFNVVRFNAGRRFYCSAVAAASAVAASGLSTWSGSIVVVNSATNNTQRYIQAGISSAAASNFRSIGTLNTGKYQAQEFIVASSAQSVGSSKTTPVVLRWEWVNGAISLWENGSSIAAAAVVSAGSNNTLGTNARIQVGHDTAGFTGHISEVLVASTAWSSAQGRELDKLLGAKYGITIT